jgi:hypothetical protein
LPQPESLIGEPTVGEPADGGQIQRTQIHRTSRRSRGPETQLAHRAGARSLAPVPSTAPPAATVTPLP